MVASRRLTDLLRSEQARQRRQNTVAQWTLPAERVAPAADQREADADDTLILLLGAAYEIVMIYVPLLMITHVVAFYLLMRPQSKVAGAGRGQQSGLTETATNSPPGQRLHAKSPGCSGDNSPGSKRP